MWRKENNNGIQHLFPPNFILNSVKFGFTVFSCIFTWNIAILCSPKTSLLDITSGFMWYWMLMKMYWYVTLKPGLKYVNKIDAVKKECTAIDHHLVKRIFAKLPGKTIQVTKLRIFLYNCDWWHGQFCSWQSSLTGGILAREVTSNFVLIDFPLSAFLGGTQICHWKDLHLLWR